MNLIACPGQARHHWIAGTCWNCGIVKQEFDKKHKAAERLQQQQRAIRRRLERQSVK